MMNISLPNLKKLILYLSILMLPASMFGQEFESIQLTMNESLTYPFYSVNAPNITTPPSHGFASLGGPNPNFGNFGNNILVYQPDVDFQGIDSIQMNYWAFDNSVVQLTHKIIEIRVSASVVQAEDDFVTTNINTPVTIDVLGNDYSSTGAIDLTSIMVVNNGTAVVNPDNVSIDFTPNPGYEGMAQFNYTTCDSLGTCDAAVVTVFVQNDNVATNDTVYLTTPKNTPISVLVPLQQGYLIGYNPDHGAVNYANAGTLEYTPDLDYVGMDNFTVVYNTIDPNAPTSALTVMITVFDAPDPNTFAFDDYAFTAIGESVDVDVTLNDFGDPLFVNPNLLEQPAFGTVTYLGDGVFSYDPEDYEGGVVKFRYKVSTLFGLFEYADVFIAVGNHNPNPETFNLVTLKNTPLIVNYDVPIDFDFVVTDDAGGKVNYYPGYTSTTINGQTVTGTNLIVYTPEEDFIGYDDFELNYCVGSTCTTVKIEVHIKEVYPQPLFCIDDCVWAGDANYDGVVDMRDLLPLGYCVGIAGVERPQASLEWYGQYCEDWDNGFEVSDSDLKHIDTNGDGLISAADTAALLSSYTRLHTLTPDQEYYVANLPLYLVPRNPNIVPGDLLVMDIVLGTEATPAFDMHGFTFSFRYNSSVVEEGTLEIDFLNQNWMSYNSPMLGLTKKPFSNINKIDVGYTRTSGVSVSGFGSVGTVKFIVDDAVDGFRPDQDRKLRIDLGDALYLTPSGQYIALTTKNLELTIQEAPNYDNGIDPSLLIAYPNPAQDFLNLHLNGTVPMEQILMYNLNGQVIYNSGNKVDLKKTAIDVTNIANGLYVVEVITEEGVITKKVEVMKFKN